MKYIHFECVRKWLKSKITMRTIGSVVSYYWKLLSCELCKENLPNSIIINGRICDLVDVHRPSSPYLLLEVKATGGDRTNSLHVVSVLTSKEIFIVKPR